MMILNRENNLNCVFGYRFSKLNPIKSTFDWGNFIFTSFFNIIFGTQHTDILCCAKAFYKNDIKKYNIISNGFDIDIELASVLSIVNKRYNIKQIPLSYDRRTFNQGKKLKIFDGWYILSRIIKTTKYL